MVFQSFLPLSTLLPPSFVAQQEYFLWIYKRDHVFGELLPVCAVVVHNLTRSKSSTFATLVYPVLKHLGHTYRIYVRKIPDPLLKMPNAG